METSPSRYPKATGPDATAADPPVQLWKSSWIDQIQGFIGRSRIPWWLLLLIVPLFLILLEMSFLVLERGVEALQWPIPLGLTVIYAVFPFYMFGWLYLIDKRAETAIQRIRPLLNEEKDYRRFSFTTSNMPFVSAILATVAGLLFFFLLRSVAGLTGEVVLSGTTETTRWIRLFEGVMLWPLMGVVTYHTIRQLGIIDQLYTRHVRIDLLNQAPLYGLARIPVYTAVSIVIPVSLILLVLPQFPHDPVSETLLLSTLAFNVLIVVAPLYRVHKELDEEKVNRQILNANMTEELLRRFREHVSSNALEDPSGIQRSLEILGLERNIIQSAPTWPWPAGFMKTVTAALLLPTVIWVIQQLLRSVLGIL